MEKKRKPRALNKSDNFKKEILRLFSEGKKPADIVKHFNGQLSYWQIYNTINPRPVEVEKDKMFLSPGGKLINSGEVPDEEDSTITGVPETDLSQFGGIEKYFEHALSVIVKQLESKKITIEKRVFLTKQLVEINKKLKAQQIEQYLKNANAIIMIRVMRRLKPEISDEDILKIYKEEAEKLRKETK